MVLFTPITLVIAENILRNICLVFAESLDCITTTIYFNGDNVALLFYISTRRLT